MEAEIRKSEETGLWEVWLPDGFWGSYELKHQAEYRGECIVGLWLSTKQDLKEMRAALYRAGGNKAKAARSIGMKRTTFIEKLRRADILFSDRARDLVA